MALLLRPVEVSSTSFVGEALGFAFLYWLLSHSLQGVSFLMEIIWLHPPPCNSEHKQKHKKSTTLFECSGLELQS